MLLDVLVQNYYERNGSFKGIENTPLHEGIMRKVKENKGNQRKTQESSGNQRKVEESRKEYETVCNEMLGYLEEGTTPENLMSLRTKCVLGEKSAMVKEASAKYGIKAIPKKKKLVVGELEGLDQLVAAYYRNNESLFISDDDGVTSFKGWLLRHSGMGLPKILAMTEVQNCLVKAEYKEKVMPTVYAGKLFLPFRITTDEMEQINRSALEIVTLKGNPVKELLKVRYVELLTLSVSHPDMYLRTLDYARANKITYAEVLGWFGIYVPDLVKAYELTGNAIISFDGSCLLYNESSDEWDSLSYDQLLTELRSQAQLLAEKERTTQQQRVKGELHELSGF